MAKRRVLLTGAAGYISSLLLPAFRERYELVLLDVTRSSGRAPGPVDDVIEVDLADPDIDRYRDHFKGIDAIVHNGHNWGEVSGTAPLQWLAERPLSDPDGYYSERVNVDMAFNVLKLALEENVRRVVITSSNHAADWYETKLHCGEMDTVYPDTYPLSDNFYGWAKATYEHLGFVFATGRFGRAVENVHVRIGAPRPLDIAKLAENQVSLRRDLGAYISESDLQQLYTKSIETEDIRDADGIPFQVFYGISNNTRAFWSLVNARRIIGYAPEDDSELLYADEIAAHLTAPGRTL
jgi:hypothetical protein